MALIKQFLSTYAKREDLPRRNKLLVLCVICKTFIPLAGNRNLESCKNPNCLGELDDLWIAEMMKD